MENEELPEKIKAHL